MGVCDFCSVLRCFETGKIEWSDVDKYDACSVKPCNVKGTFPFSAKPECLFAF